MVYKNYKIIRRFGGIKWWNHWKSKRRNKKQECGSLGALLAPLAPSLVQSLISSVVKGISGRGVRRGERGYINKYF